ncbi:MAG: bifunctional 4-hydroxy-2-oxoglutarate aldolase/2-dehydro-3-deoxy-phosphogluconate aldolase [Acidimicrobiia bacterium]|nr:bifunctional 4-hydroxy-2-oxoglutarate aldolase/2-dehydro-3-deoxy-phosphogluconate aldolase [Acidimicrobiia bacterium]
MNRAALPDRLIAERVVAVARGQDPAAMRSVAAALAAGGLGVIEVTMDSPGARESIADLAGGELLVGAGTVRSEAEAVAAIDAGAQFVVSPHLDNRIVTVAVEAGVPVIPGAFTPTEITTAWDMGATAVKLFPASLGGPSLVKALRGPLGDIPLLPTGGVSVENAPLYLEAGAVAVGIGGWLTGGSDYELMQIRAEQLAGACR